jgi:hypothetical protein
LTQLYTKADVDRYAAADAGSIVDHVLLVGHRVKASDADLPGDHDRDRRVLRRPCRYSYSCGTSGAAMGWLRRMKRRRSAAGKETTSMSLKSSA